VEYQVTPDTVLKATYVGTHSDHLQVSVPTNLVAPQKQAGSSNQRGGPECASSGICHCVQQLKSAEH